MPQTIERIIEIEREFDQVIQTLGGRRVSELVGESPGLSNADYLFDQAEVVAELKCLQDNKLQDVELNNKLMALYRRWKRDGLNVSLSVDGFRATLGNLPQHCAKQILELYAKPIRKRILKANKQIKQTKEKLGRPNDKGLLLLANDGNLALDPEHIWHILSHILRDGFSGINSIVFFTVNMPSRASFTNVDLLVWANWHRPNQEAIDDEFLMSLYRAWGEHISRILKTPVPTIRLRTNEHISSIRNTGTNTKDLF